MSEAAEFVLGPMSGERLRVAYVRREPEDWHRFLVEARSSGFSARFECDTQLDCLKAFRQQTNAMALTLRGATGLEFTEGSVAVDAVIDKTGRIRWEITLTAPSGDGPTLTFGIDDDQTSLGALVEQIDIVLNAATVDIRK